MDNKRDVNLAVCMVGTLIPEEWFQTLQTKSKMKAAGSPLFMQKRICKSLYDENVDISVLSYPPVAAFPGSSLVGVFGKKYTLYDKIPVRTISFVNIAILKQMTVFLAMLCNLVHWSLKKSGKDRSILVYADFIEYALPALIVGKLFKTKVVLFLTEKPGIEHYHTGKITIRDRVLFWSERKKLLMHHLFDGFIFMTEPLNLLVNHNNAPYTIMEGFVDYEMSNMLDIYEKETIPTAMYAGSLGEAYNVKMLIDAFCQTKGDYRLWIYGDGKYRDYVKDATNKDKRIVYFGTVPRSEVMVAEKKASVLMHVKDNKDEHSKYSFSSKIIEYFSSGTPMITTVVEGIPAEYYQYAYKVKHVEVDELRRTLEHVLNKPQNELIDMGQKAKSFLFANKNAHVQAQKIIKVMIDSQRSPNA